MYFLRGIKDHIGNSWFVTNRKIKKWLVGVRNFSASHAGNRGSSPLGVTTVTLNPLILHVNINGFFVLHHTKSLLVQTYGTNGVCHGASILPSQEARYLLFPTSMAVDPSRHPIQNAINIMIFRHVTGLVH